MKKFLFSILVIAMAFTASAQGTTIMSLKAGDTLITAGTLDTVFKYIPVTNNYTIFTVQVVTTKLSGTVPTTEKAYLYYSLDGKNYTVSDSSSAFANQTTNIAYFSKTSVPYTNYQVQVRDAAGQLSTQNNLVTVNYVLRK